MPKKIKLSDAAMQYFADSALTRAHADKMQIRDVGVEELQKLLPSMAGVIGKYKITGHEIPYLGPDGQPTGFCRYRMHEDSDGSPKYLQVKGTKSRIYFPPFADWEKIAADPSATIYITEGERKAAAACAAGFVCLGLGGVWNFLAKSTEDGTGAESSELIKDFRQINWANRSVVIVYDSDAQYNGKVRAAIAALRGKLVELGADPYRIDLPHVPGSAKVGLDDFLKQKGGKKAFANLPRIPLFLNHTKTGAEILKQKFAPTTWVVKGLLPSGLTVLSGPPKTGKSWLILAIVLAIANGSKALGCFDAEPAECLYLALEDSESRLQNRLKQLVPVFGNASERAHFACAWERVSDDDGVGGCLLAIERRLDQMPNCKAVFIDTLAKMRKASSGRGDRYQEDYEAVDALKRIADRRGIAVVLVHHTRKALASDFLDRVSGTAGITGAADTIMVLERSRNEATATLNITGRDIWEQAMALRFKDGTWTYCGDAPQVRATEAQAAILDLMREEGRPLGPKEIADLTGRQVGSLPKTLQRMVRDELIERVEKGKYVPVEQAAAKPSKFAGGTGAADSNNKG